MEEAQPPVERAREEPDEHGYEIVENGRNDYHGEDKYRYEPVHLIFLGSGIRFDTAVLSKEADLGKYFMGCGMEIGGFEKVYNSVLIIHRSSHSE